MLAVDCFAFDAGISQFQVHLGSAGLSCLGHCRDLFRFLYYIILLPTHSAQECKIVSHRVAAVKKRHMGLTKIPGDG